MASQLYINQRLRTLTNEYVKIMKIDRNNIVVEFRGKIYVREKSIVGKKLFILPEDLEEEEEIEKSCYSCFIRRSEDCFGRAEICKDYKHVASVSKERIDSWPKYGDATYYRMKSRGR